MHTNPRSYLYNGSIKAIPLNALPESAWTPIGGDSTPTTVQIYADAVAYLYRCIEVKAAALTAVPWQIAPASGDAEPLWISTDEDPPAQLQFAADLPSLLWRTAVSWAFSSEAFWLNERNRVRLLNLRWLDPSSMTPVWDAKQGLTGFERRIGTRTETLGLEDVTYLWRAGLRETTPSTPPAQAAMQAAGVLYNADKFASDFFERGAIKATFLAVDGNPPKADLDAIGAWWKRFFSGIKNAWEVKAVRGDIKAVPVGEGLDGLSNSTLTEEKRQDIATALGVPHSLIMANAANYATASQDEKNFYNLTIIPDCLLIQRQLNRQLFTPLGLRFTFNPQEMTVFQEDETQRSQAFATYVSAGISLPVAAEMLGLYLPDGMTYADLEPEEPEPTSTDMQSSGNQIDGAKGNTILGYHIETGVVTRNEARAPLGLPPIDDSQDRVLRDLNAKLDTMLKATQAGIPIEQAAAMVGLAVEIPEEPEVTPDAPTVQEEVQAEEGRQAVDGRDEEVARLKRWLKKKPDRNPADFQSAILDDWEKAAIAASLKGAQPSETGNPFPDWSAYP